jgi:hypothetical protein
LRKRLICSKRESFFCLKNSGVEHNLFLDIELPVVAFKTFDATGNIGNGNEKQLI